MTIKTKFDIGDLCWIMIKNRCDSGSVMKLDVNVTREHKNNGLAPDYDNGFKEVKKIKYYMTKKELGRIEELKNTIDFYENTISRVNSGHKKFFINWIAQRGDGLTLDKDIQDVIISYMKNKLIGLKKEFENT